MLVARNLGMQGSLTTVPAPVGMNELEHVDLSANQLSGAIDGKFREHIWRALSSRRSSNIYSHYVYVLCLFIFPQR